MHIHINSSLFVFLYVITNPTKCKMNFPEME